MGRLLHLLLALIAAVAALALPAHAAALTVDAAAVTLNPKKTDAFAVKGTFAPFDAASVAEVRVELGAFTQTIPVASFTSKKGKLSYKGPKGAPGLATLTLDTTKGKFAASGKNLSLGPFDNPAALHVVAGALDECSTLTFAEIKNKRKLASSVPACGFQSRPTAAPDVIFVNTPTEVRVHVAVVDDLALDLGSLVVLRLDAALQPVGAPACTLHDDGSPASGDDTAVDGVFSCRFTMAESAPGQARFAVRALRDTVLVSSPSFSVAAVTPLTGGEVTAVMTAQNAASEVWDAVLAELGNTKKARKEAAARILDIPGVADAGLAADGANIFIEYTNGLSGGLDLDPFGDPVAVPLGRNANAVSATVLQPPPRTARAVSTAAPRIGNAKVLIWSAFENENGYAEKATAELQALFEQSTCPKFEVTVLKNEQCTLASIGTFQDYGTVVILTHGAQPRQDKDVGLMTREKATLVSEWLTNARDIQSKRLLVYQGRFPEKRGYFIFFPSFVARMNDRGFPNSVIFAGACSSAGNRSLASTFFVRGALAYVGFSFTEHAEFLRVSSLSFFTNLLQPGTTVADAFARVPFKTLKQYLTANGAQMGLLADYGPTLTTKLVLERGDGRLAYPCGAPPTGLVDTVTIQAGPMAHAVGAVRLEAGVKYRLVVSGTTKTTSPEGGFGGGGFAERDALYCFDDKSGFCTPPFPDDSLLGFYVQSGDEEPGFSDLQGIGEFTDLGVKPYSASHRYEYAWTGREGKLWLTAYPSNFPDDGIAYTGSYTVEIHRD